MAGQTQPHLSASEQEQGRLAQAAQILAHLQSQLAELDRREQQLNQQMSVASERQREVYQRQEAAERRLVHLQKQLQTREDSLTARESELQTRQNRLESQQSQLQQEAELYRQKQRELDESIQEARQQLENETRTQKLRLQQDSDKAAALLKQQLEREFEERRQQNEKQHLLKQAELEARLSQLDSDSKRLEQERQEFATFMESEKQKHEEEYRSERLRLSDQAQKELEAARVQLEQDHRVKADQIAADFLQLQQDQEHHAQVVAAWKADQQLEREQLTAEKQSTLLQLQSDFDAEVAEQRKQIESIKAELQLRLDQHESQVTAWYAQQAREKAELQAWIDHESQAFEKSCSDRLQDFESLIASEKQKLTTDREQFEIERSSHSTEVAAWSEQQTREREELDRELKAKRETFLQECERREQELVATLEAERQALHDEWQRRHDELEASHNERSEQLEVQFQELETERLLHTQQVDEWIKLRQVQQTELEATLAERRKELEAEFTQEREAFEHECLVKNKEFEEQIQTEKESLEAERLRLRDELMVELSEERKALAATREQMEADQQEHQRIAQTWSSERTLERSKLLEELEDLKKEKLGSLDQRERHLERREIDLQKRTALHEQHLERIRMELSSTKSQLEKQRQQQIVWREDVEKGIRLRLAHMKRFRDLMGQREECLEEEQRLFHEVKRSSELELIRARKSFQEDRVSWNQLKASAEERLQLLESRLQTEYDQLVNNFREVTSLGDELERLIEDAVSRSKETSGHASRHLNGLLAILVKQKREADQSVQYMQQRLHETRTENAEISAWIEERDQNVSAREEQQRQSLDALQLREEEFAAARESWNQDRMQAEQVIRELVVQLEMALDQIARFQSTEDAPAQVEPSRNAA